MENKEFRKLRKECWEEIMKKANGNYNLAMKILDGLSADIRGKEKSNG